MTQHSKKKKAKQKETKLKHKDGAALSHLCSKHISIAEMAFELLVEIPETVTKIFHLGSSASNLGLRCPTVLAFKGSIALINVSYDISIK